MTDPISELAYAPVHVLTARMARGELTARDLMEAFLARIEANGRLAAYVCVYAEDAQRAAAAADEAIRSGHRLGPFHGIPVAIKDIIEIEGRITTGGCKHYAKRVSPVTATLVRRLIGAGMIVLGKTHTVEFAMGGWGTNRHMGTPRNPWDSRTHRAPGGSSSGTGVAVAAGLAPWGIGTDTGGSVRLPAAWCGLTALKVTVGRISLHGILPLSPTLDTPGPMCRCVQDAADLFEVLQGPDANDPATGHHPPSHPTRSLGIGVRGMCLARFPAAERAGVDGEMLAAYDESLETLQSLGARIADIELPFRFDDMKRIAPIIFAAEGYSQYGDLIDDPAVPMDEDVRARFRGGRDMLAREYLQALQERERLKHAFEEAMRGVDALLTPTTETAAPAIDTIDQRETPARFTRAVNVLDLCAIAIPNGFTARGLPLSLQVICRGYEEEMALRIGAAYQRATDWHARHPGTLS
jgi:aspartyl-tRNA(Asn)/glutamyl-tRNA(Gln) amidotransferase subunit A